MSACNFQFPGIIDSVSVSLLLGIHFVSYLKRLCITTIMSYCYRIRAHAHARTHAQGLGASARAHNLGRSKVEYWRWIVEWLTFALSISQASCEL